MKSRFKFPKINSKEEYIDLVKKCKKDPIFFIENFVIPADLDEPIKLYPKQKFLIETILKDHDVIINSSRQVGKTTAISAFMVWLLLFFKEYRIAVISKDRDHATDIILDVYTMLENLPSYFRPKKYLRDRVHEKMLPNGSRIKSYAVPKDNPDKVARGIRVGFLFIDETAFVPKIKEVFTAALPATSRLQKLYKEKGYPYGIVLSSTPGDTEGDGRWYYEKWMEAVQGNSNFKPITIHYSEVPDYDPQYMQQLKKKFKKEDWEREYELKFVGGKNAFLDSNILLEIQFKNKPLIENVFKDESGEFYVKVYKEFEEDKLYIIGVDTASGAGGKSRQAFVVFEYPTEIVTAVGYGKLNIMKFANIIENFTLNHFKNDNYLIIIERNMNGEAVIDYYRDKDSPIYNRLYKVLKSNSKNPFKLENQSYQIGITTTSKNRQLMFDALYTFLTENLQNLKNVLLPEELRNEILGLKYNGRRVEAASGLNDDLVMAFNLILYAKYYDTKNFRRQVAGVEIETINEDDVIDVLKLNLDRYSTRF